MFLFNDKVLYFSLFNAIGYIWTLVQIPEAEHDDIATTETIIRNTVNNLFANFKIKDVKHRPRLKDFSVIHNFFVSMTLKDCDNLKEIASLTRVNNIDNNTNHLITQINEVLNEGDNSNEETDDVYVTKHIETFINKLRHLKEIHGLNDDFGNFSINAEILKILNNEESIPTNFTDEIHYGNDTDEKVLADLEVWTPIEQSGRRIFDGHRTRIKYYPFIATVQFFEKFQCAGSILRRDIVVTAASCLQLAYNNRFFRENPAFLSVQVGCDYYEAGGENIGVLDIFFHPEYTPQTLNNNIALLRLGTNIVFSKKITNVKRIFFDRKASPLPSNTDGIIILGWGARDSSNIIYGPWRNRLSFAELDIYPLKECQEIYSKQYVTYKNFCAGFFSKGTGACSHDVGGPGISGGVLLGVISFGPPICGTPDAPTVFTKIGYYTNWIDNIMRQEVSRIVRLSTKRRSKSTFALHYSDQTRAHFTVRPIEAGEGFPGYIPIPKGAGSLRILKNDKVFKEFMSTMFESREAKDYVTSPGVEESCDDDDNDATTKKPKRKSKNNKSKSDILPHATANPDENEIALGTRVSKVKGNKNYNNITNKRDIRVDKKSNADDDSKLNDDIKNLLDDLDLYKLLNSEEVIMNSGDNDDIAARALEIIDPDETNINKKKHGKKSKLSQATGQGKKKNKKFKHRSLKKLPLLLQGDEGINDKGRKRSTRTIKKSVTHVKISDGDVTDKSVQNMLYSYDRDENLNEDYTERNVRDETEYNISDNNTDTSETMMTANETLQDQFDSSNKDEGSNELLKPEKKISSEVPNLSANEHDSGENMTASDKSVQNDLPSPDNEETSANKEQLIFYKGREMPTTTLSNVDDNDHSNESIETTRTPILKKSSFKKGAKLNENDEESQKAEETSGVSDADEDIKDNNQISQRPVSKLSKSAMQEKSSNNINTATTVAAQTTLESSENNDETESDEDEDASEDNSGLSIAA